MSITSTTLVLTNFIKINAVFINSNLIEQQHHLLTNEENIHSILRGEF